MNRSGVVAVAGDECSHVVGTYAVVTLVFTPSGAPPPAEGEVLGGGWTLEERSLF